MEYKNSSTEFSDTLLDVLNFIDSYDLSTMDVINGHSSIPLDGLAMLIDEDGHEETLHHMYSNQSMGFQRSKMITYNEDQVPVQEENVHQSTKGVFVLKTEDVTLWRSLMESSDLYKRHCSMLVHEGSSAVTLNQTAMVPIDSFIDNVLIEAVTNKSLAFLEKFVLPVKELVLHLHRCNSKLNHTFMSSIYVCKKCNGFITTDMQYTSFRMIRELKKSNQENVRMVINAVLDVFTYPSVLPWGICENRSTVQSAVIGGKISSVYYRSLSSRDRTSFMDFLEVFVEYYRAVALEYRGFNISTAYCELQNLFSFGS